ncbi:type I-E CRISPR-associated protein Cse2/CasB [Acidomonas methanolica]|uniref:Uncharacterized protein n=1 Tax=Acidomonas methanolica NBRC 104435 TaxID=1231351 RepID=A0A023D2T9_ACIMT|nr:type I-E CRISPR-associated protein Cse2/CasB [Acidomonas methanolica]TCS21566.1 CRISPR-associated protein Cse2 family [Acidomonas methanolica]GAJ28389.1 hypothetical protein Amme_021_004 [Acidomonas methanolica NBRC 104435]GBQ45838.1 hypothetical protein AA0498_0152 [Acidomonas methanolica]GEL00391.1 hypothetical protein AME01nite_28890 [Acidomonas methanolica NBRC 104435]
MTPPESLARSDVNSDIRHLAELSARDEDDGGLSSGDRAELRRMKADGVLPPAFWRQIVRLGIRNESLERAWAILIQAMLEAGEPKAEPVGRALGHRNEATGEVPYAEPRFIQLLRARGHDEVAFHVRQAARWCGAKGRRLRFSDHYGRDGFGPFILAAAQGHEEDAARRAHAIARDYFSTLQRAERDTEV